MARGEEKQGKKEKARRIPARGVDTDAPIVNAATIAASQTDLPPIAMDDDDEWDATPMGKLSPEATKKKERDDRVAQQLAKCDELVLSRLSALADDDELKALLRMIAHRPKYSANNMMLIMAQNPAATDTRSFSMWKKSGRHVRKGETGMKIYAPKAFYTRKDINGNPLIDPDTGKEQRIPGGYTVRTTFDISQTEGPDVPPMPEPIPLTGESEEAMALGEHLLRWCDLKGVEVKLSDAASDAVRLNGGVLSVPAEASRDERVFVIAREIARDHMRQLRTSDGIAKLSSDQLALASDAAAYAVCQAGGLDADQATLPHLMQVAADPETMRSVVQSVQTFVKDVFPSSD